MVKTFVSMLLSLALLVSAALFEHFYIGGTFEKFDAALVALECKVREEVASREDAEAVRALWLADKKDPHAVIPHNDIAQVDYWLGEAVSCIETQTYPDALSSLEVLETICRQIPLTYRITFENIF